MDEKWTREPNEYRFFHEGYWCIARRQQQLKYWLGYVVVNRGHPWYGVHNAELQVPVHGGITFADHCPFSPDPRQDEWWVGIDCSHAFDLIPYDWERERDHPGLFKGHIYRDFEYIKTELRKLSTMARAAADITAEQSRLLPL